MAAAEAQVKVSSRVPAPHLDDTTVSVKAEQNGSEMR